MKLVYGVGINDLGYKISRHESFIDEYGNKKTRCVWTCPFYQTWLEMLRRGFSEKEKKRHPKYKDVTVCDEWLSASKFKSWMEKQEWKGLDLDKDILSEGNLIYSPETCVFVPSYINTLLVTSDSIRGVWPLGVSLLKDQIEKGRPKIFRASIKDKRSKEYKQKNLGHFVTPQEAHVAWQVAKCEVISKRLAEYLKEDCFNERIFRAIKTKQLKLKLDMFLGKETVRI